MPGKFLHSGNSVVYEIKKGKFLHSGNSVVYEIKKGKFLHSGNSAVYTINFEAAEMKDILKHVEFIGVSGVNSATKSNVSVNLSGKVGTYFAFSIGSSYCAIWKIVSTGTSVTATYLCGNRGSTGGGIKVSGTTIYCADAATSPNTISEYGLTLAVVNFTSVTPAQAESIIRAYGQSSTMNSTGRSSYNAASIALSNSYLASKIIIAATGNQIAFTSTNASKQRTVLSYSGTNASNGLVFAASTLVALNLSTSNTSTDTFYGGHITAWG